VLRHDGETIEFVYGVREKIRANQGEEGVLGETKDWVNITDDRIRPNSEILQPVEIRCLGYGSG
jgi:hypothetical protein